MRRAIVAAFRLALACTLLAAHASAASNLVSAQWLQDNLGRDGMLVLDASSSRLYAAKHIPGAVSVDLYTYGSPHNVATAEMERRIQSWGVSPGRKVVLYDEGASMNATWLFYELHYHGVPASDLAILDGGLAKWQAIGGEVTNAPTPRPEEGTFRVTSTREDHRVRLAEFVTASGDPAKHALVEALDPASHFGATKFFDRAGHVPNALMFPVSDFFNADKTFKSPDEIRRMAAHLGIRPDQRVHAHCGGGIAATVPYFALRFVSGYPDVRVYKESQLEWLRDERGLPFWTYDAPYLKREMQWLSGWNSRMTRMYGVSDVSVVDVRTSDAYRENHVPFAVSVPHDVFRAHRNDLTKLAELLGSAGVDPAHEAVIVGQGGIDADAALAFVLLEHLGQRKVSLLMESVDDWGLAGHPLTKEATRVGARKSPNDIVVAPAVYKDGPRNAMIVRDAVASSKALYPRVFVAFGQQRVTPPGDGTLVHVPYTELLAANRTPKPAHDLWTILTKAGVPRYAELIAIADDPGEAAIGYYVLRLMGFPDVKLLMR